MFNKDPRFMVGNTIARYEELLKDFCEIVEKQPLPAQKSLYLRACRLLHRTPLAEDEMITRILKSKGVRR